MRWTAVLFSHLLIILAAGPANARGDIKGIWYDNSGKGAVEIYDCGKRLCGRVYWMINPAARDKFNPSTRKQRRFICGIQVIAGLNRMPDGSWDEGRVYDPKTGKSHDLAVRSISPTELEITGYAGVKFLSRSFRWKRAPATLQPCKAPAA